MTPFPPLPFEFPKDLQHPTARLCLTAAYLLEYWGKNGTIPEYTSVIAGLRADALEMLKTAVPVMGEMQ